jgi:hydroxymethylpyrimidine/phosphomethylpyrimidine kinase
MTQAKDSSGGDRRPAGRVLAVAGSDSGGGAGIQADVKTVTALGGFAASALTAVTIQNTRGVSGVIALSPAAVVAQIDAVLADIGADAVKTGMLGETALVEAVCERLSRLPLGVSRVIDPVMVATSGDRLLPESAVDAVRMLALPLAGLVTPNAPEAEILTGKAVDSIDGQRRAAERLLRMGAEGVLVKGGHIPGSGIVDLLATGHGEWRFESQRIDTRATHGTGCTLAAGVAAGLARGLSLHDAVGLSRSYLHEAIARAAGHGSGAAPVHHGWPAQDPEGFARLMARWRLL